MIAHASTAMAAVSATAKTGLLVLDSASVFSTSMPGDQRRVDGALTAGGLRQGGAGSPGHRGLGFAAPGAFLVGALGGPLGAGSGFFHTPLCGCLFGWQAAGLSGTVGSFLTLARRNVK